MPSIEYDLEYLRAGLAVLEDTAFKRNLLPVSASAPAGEPTYRFLTRVGCCWPLSV
jgi:hypothetical protein